MSIDTETRPADAPTLTEADEAAAANKINAAFDEIVAQQSGSEDLALASLAMVLAQRTARTNGLAPGAVRPERPRSIGLLHRQRATDPYTAYRSAQAGQAELDVDDRIDRATDRADAASDKLHVMGVRALVLRGRVAVLAGEVRVAQTDSLVSAAIGIEARYELDRRARAQSTGNTELKAPDNDRFDGEADSVLANLAQLEGEGALRAQYRLVQSRGYAIDAAMRYGRAIDRQIGKTNRANWKAAHLLTLDEAPLYTREAYAAENRRAEATTRLREANEAALGLYLHTPRPELALTRRSAQKIERNRYQERIEAAADRAAEAEAMQDKAAEAQARQELAKLTREAYGAVKHTRRSVRAANRWDRQEARILDEVWYAREESQAATEEHERILSLEALMSGDQTYSVYAKRVTILGRTLLIRRPKLRRNPVAHEKAQRSGRAIHRSIRKDQGRRPRRV